MSDTSVPDPKKPVSTLSLREMKRAGLPIVVITAYDAPSARMVEEAGADIVLVGDSLGMVVLGRDSTLPVTVEEMLHHTKAVRKGASRALVVADMPFMSYQVTPEEAMRNAGRMMAEGGAQAVKIEGGLAVAGTVRRLTEAGIPVMGHVGLTPQSVHQLGGYRVQGKDIESALKLVEDCLALQDAGAFAIVLECIPEQLSAIVSQKLAIPTIGIGAGAGCDGQVQVFHDILGLGGQSPPRHAKQYVNLSATITHALRTFTGEVRDHAFPGKEHSTQLDPEVLAELKRA
ncbi:MAG: 3-methyl-2-oxobutanoate hydroxymethyltransferase [Actinobacteria bacterium]|nr:3-methyl-2-oxobutanoate hydroxymethyltransferase [Actinomycetota bacterium]